MKYLLSFAVIVLIAVATQASEPLRAFTPPAGPIHAAAASPATKPVAIPQKRATTTRVLQHTAKSVSMCATPGTDCLVAGWHYLLDEFVPAAIKARLAPL